MKLSEKHHYIPELFIKGFCSDDNKISIYYTDKNKIEKIRRSASQILFERNRNLINEKDNLEKIYGIQENEFSKVYKKIIANEFPTDISNYDFIQLVYFIETLHWRVPAQDSEVKNIINESSFKDLGLISKRNSNTDDAFDKVKKDKGFIKIANILKSIQAYSSYDLKNNMDDWHISYIPKIEQGYNLLGDNPIILENKNSENILNTNFRFNLSKDKAIYKSSNKYLRKLTPKDQLNLDLLTFLQAKKMVCCTNSDYLNDVVELARTYYNTEKKIEILRNEVFTLNEK
jgi:hypothetical protein